MRLFTEYAQPVLQKKSTKSFHPYKNITIFLLLSLLVIDPMLVTFTWLQHKKTIVKKEVKRQIKEGIDKDEIVLLTFTKEETQTKLRWEHPREFEYNHRMYDIVKSMTEGDTVYYWCWYDHEETMLNRRLKELKDQASGKSHKIRKYTALILSTSESLTCLFPYNGDVSIPKLFYKQDGLFYHFSSQIFIQPPTPPPQSS
ncbi:MAG: hypothetical protein ACOC6P_03345 [Candidatus Aminicenantaceae bacterium]